MTQPDAFKKAKEGLGFLHCRRCYNAGSFCNDCIDKALSSLANGYEKQIENLENYQEIMTVQFRKKEKVLQEQHEKEIKQRNKLLSKIGKDLIKASVNYCDVIEEHEKEKKEIKEKLEDGFGDVQLGYVEHPDIFKEIKEVTDKAFSKDGEKCQKNTA